MVMLATGTVDMNRLAGDLRGMTMAAVRAVNMFRIVSVVVPMRRSDASVVVRRAACGSGAVST
jgi:hypothetical protein